MWRSGSPSKRSGSLDGTRIRTASSVAVVATGAGCPAPATVTFDMDGSSGRFGAEIGEVDDDGAVAFRVVAAVIGRSACSVTVTGCSNRLVERLLGGLALAHA